MSTGRDDPVVAADGGRATVVAMPAAPPASLKVLHHLPPSVGGVVRAAIPMADVPVFDVAIHVRRHGIRRAWYRPCEDGCCPLRRNVKGPISARVPRPGHYFPRRKDLRRCVGSAPIVPIDHTRFWTTGRTYNGVPAPASVPPWTRFVVTLKVPQVVQPGQLPAERTYHRAKRAGPTRIEIPEDDVVHVLAHELVHVDQFRTGRPASEVEAETRGREILNRWRDAGRHGLT